MAKDNSTRTKWWERLRTILLPDHRGYAPPSERPTDELLTARRRAVAGHALWTLVLLCALVALVPAVVALVALVPIVAGQGGDPAIQVEAAIKGLRATRTKDQHLFMLPLVGGVLVASYFFVFNQATHDEYGVDEDTPEHDPLSVRTFLGIQLALVLLCAVVGSAWMALPPESEAMDWAVAAAALTLAYLCCSLARLVMSDHVRALSWSYSQWEAWARSQAARADSLKRSGTKPFGVRSAAGAAGYLFIPLSLFSCGLAAVSRSEVPVVWTLYAWLPGGLLAIDAFVASSKRVSAKWGSLIVMRLLEGVTFLGLGFALLASDGLVRLSAVAWLGCLWYSYRSVSAKYGADLDLRHLEWNSSSIKTSEAAVQHR